MEKSIYLTEIRQIKNRFGFDFVSFAAVLKGVNPLLTWMYATGNLSNRYKRIVLESGKGIAGGVYKSGRAMVIQNAPEELSPEERVEHPITIAEELISMMAVPLWRQDKVDGILLMAFRKPYGITEELFMQVIQEITPSFCDFTVHRSRFDQVLQTGSQTKTEPVPVYELMNFHIIQAQESERRRISRDIHDSVVQEMLGVQLLLRTLKYQKNLPDTLAVADEADLWLSRIQTELRNIASSLRPMALDDLGLIATFLSHFKRIEAGYGVVVRFQQNIGSLRFGSDVETVFYRVCQEAVINACKYSGSDEITVNLLASNGFLTLEVTDRGVGFCPDELEIQGSGLGLPGMAERAELIDGEFTYQTAPGKGTSIWLTAPVGRREAL